MLLIFKKITTLALKDKEVIFLWISTCVLGWLILYVNLAGLWGAQIFGQMLFWMFCKGVFGWDLHLNQWTPSISLPSTMWVGLTQSAEGLKKTKGWPLWSKRNFSTRLPLGFICNIGSSCFYSRLSLHSNCNSIMNFQPASLPHQIVESPSSHNCVSQFLKINLILCVCVCVCVCVCSCLCVSFLSKEKTLKYYFGFKN